MSLVSIIIPVFNRPEMLVDAVNSVFEQTHKEVEIIIVDDASTDNTLDVAQQLAKQHSNVSAVSANGKGPGAARETGRLLAKGEFIQYLDSDDLLLPNKLESQLKLFEKHPEAHICYGKETRRGADYSFSNYDEFDSEETIKSTSGQINTIFPHILYGSLWGTSVPLWKRSFTDELGAWLPLINEEDVEYDARAGGHQAQLIWVDEFVAVQRVHDEHLSSGGATEPKKLRHRVTAQQDILEHAFAAKLELGSDALNHYAKNVFLLARQCAAVGMKDEMLKAMALSGKASTHVGMRLKIYTLSCRILGCRNTQLIFSLLERFR